MATLTVTPVSLTGTTLSIATAGASGDKFAPGDTVFFHVVNITGSSRTVTIDSPTNCNQGGSHDVVVVVDNGDAVDIGPFPAQRFAGTDGLVSVTYSGTNLAVAAFRV